MTPEQAWGRFLSWLAREDYHARHRGCRTYSVCCPCGAHYPAQNVRWDDKTWMPAALAWCEEHASHENDVDGYGYIRKALPLQILHVLAKPEPDGQIAMVL